MNYNRGDGSFGVSAGVCVPVNNVEKIFYQLLLACLFFVFILILGSLVSWCSWLNFLKI